MTTTARVIADSIADGCPRLTTFLVRFPHIILPQVLTHRVFSRNTSSSRAIPIERLIDDVERDPFIPSEWRYAADRGMQPGGRMGVSDDQRASDIWCGALDSAISAALRLGDIGATKEHANRLLEPFSHVNMVITSTEWDNWNALRLDEHAQIEIRELAQAMKDAMNASTPRVLKMGDWHMPFVTEIARSRPDAPMLSAARCARTSYLTHEGKPPVVANDLALAETLLCEWHMSPFEAQAKVTRSPDFNGNFSGNWAQHRKIIEARNNPLTRDA